MNTPELINQEKEQKEKLGVWLILFKVLLIISIIRGSYNLIEYGSLIDAISFVLCMVTFLLMIHRQRAFILFAIILLWYAPIVDLIFLPFFFEEMTFGMTGAYFIGRIVVCLAWTIYFLSSSKVKRIFKERIFN